MTVADQRDRAAERESPRSSTRGDGIPRHIAIIMDGNGRWAQARRQPRTEGHSAGVSNIRRVLTHLQRRGVEYVTVFAFSTENWERPQKEVSFLLDLLLEALRTEVGELHRDNVRVLHVGRLDRLPDGYREEIQDAVALTANNTGITFSVAFNYGGRDEIVEATRRIVADGIEPAEIDETLISRYMFCPDVPDPDLVVRTGGELRISNFLLWQTAYSEFYSTPATWPDFDDEEADRALDAYANRNRRFGRLNESAS